MDDLFEEIDAARANIEYWQDILNEDPTNPVAPNVIALYEEELEYLIEQI